MEEIVSQFHGWTRVLVYKIKRNDYVSHDVIRTYINCEEKAVKLLFKLTHYHGCAFLICNDNQERPQVPLDQIFSETSSDLCLIQKKNYLFIRDFDSFNLALISGDTSLVIYPQGIEKFTGSGRSSYEYPYYFIPILGLILFLYIIEREISKKERNKKLLV